MSPAQEAMIHAWTRAQLRCRWAYNRERAIEEATPDEAKRIRKASYRQVQATRIRKAAAQQRYRDRQRSP